MAKRRVKVTNEEAIFVLKDSIKSKFQDVMLEAGLSNDELLPHREEFVKAMDGLTVIDEYLE